MRKWALLAGVLFAGVAAAGCATAPPVTGPSTRDSVPAAEVGHRKTAPAGPTVSEGAKKTQTAEATVDVRVVDAVTGQIIYAESGTGVHETSSTEVLGIGGRTGYDETMEGKAFRAAVSKFIDNLIGKMVSMEWTGKVASVEGGEVTLNAGKKTGLAVGDRLRVYGEGREVIDPDTKVSLGRRPGAEKGEIQIVDFFGGDASIGKVLQGKGFAVNDIVRFGK